MHPSSRRESEPATARPLDAELVQKMHAYFWEYGQDMPEVRDWRWTGT